MGDRKVTVKVETVDDFHNESEQSKEEEEVLEGDNATSANIMDHHFKIEREGVEMRSGKMLPRPRVLKQGSEGERRRDIPAIQPTKDARGQFWRVPLKTSNRPTSVQLEALAKFLEQHPGIARGLFRTTLAKLETKQKWNQCAVSLNALGGANKDGRGWAKYWTEKKFSIKKQCFQNAALLRNSGARVERNEVYMLSTMDKRLLSVMGLKSFPVGDAHPAVNPAPQTPTIETNAPSTSMMDTAEEVLEQTDVDIVPPPSSISTSERIAVEPPVIPSEPIPHPFSSTTNARRRSRRAIPRNLDISIDRMARIEEQRVEAERTTAEAFAETSRRLEGLTNATEHVAQAITQVANALQQIANNLARN